MSVQFALPTALAFAVALISPVLFVPLLQRLGVIDIPNHRSSHRHAVVRGAGVAQACGIAIGLIVALLFAKGHDRALIAVILGTCLGAAALGMSEDLRGIPIAVRAGFQFLIGFVAASVAAISTDHSVWWGILGGIALLGLINVVNFMDGVDAISSFHGIVVGLTFVVVGLLENADWLVTSGAVLAAAFAAFLPWNLTGRMFLGDVGSYLLGGGIAIIIAIGWMDGLSIIALAAPLSIYVADTSVTLISRVVAGETWYEAHRDHTYQRLNRAGFSHLSVASMVVAGSGLCAGLGLLASVSTDSTRILAIIGLVLVVCAYTATRFALTSQGFATPMKER